MLIRRGVRAGRVYAMVQGAINALRVQKVQVWGRCVVFRMHLDGSGYRTAILWWKERNLAAFTDRKRAGKSKLKELAVDGQTAWLWENFFQDKRRKEDRINFSVKSHINWTGDFYQENDKVRGKIVSLIAFVGSLPEISHWKKLTFHYAIGVARKAIIWH